MMLSRKFVTVLGVVAAMSGLTGCNQLEMKRVRITVTLAEGARLYEGSAVQVMGCRKPDPLWGSMDLGNCEVHGEAVVIPLEGSRFVVMPFGGGEFGDDFRSYVDIMSRPPSSSNAEAWDISQDKVPLFVTFDDPEFPTTVSELNRESSLQLNSGIKLVTVHLEATNDYLTRGKIEALLPWLKTLNKDYFLTGKIVKDSSQLAANINSFDFENWK